MTSQQTNSGSPRRVFAIPDYLSTKTDGLYILLPKFHSGEAFATLVNEIFSSDLLFAGLNYDVFLKLMYDDEWLVSVRAKASELKIATGIAPFAEHRRALYKTVKVLERGHQAEYVFEPVSVEVTVEEPVYGEPDASGVAPLIRHNISKTVQPATLELDEFIAAMWGKGIRYGIRTEEVRKSMAERASGRKIIAVGLEPVEGKDADILEVCPDLHRDNSPRTMSNGRADMRAYQNRFPHIAKGARLLKKVPRVFGKIGYKVTGEVIEPVVPKDLNLLAMASTGTTAKMEADGDYLVAEMDGFLNIDPLTNTISLTEKIETTAGVSMKTTGDLALNVDEFIEHGEVQEGRVVKGRHMTFKANVFGNLVSTNGNISVEGNLTGGMADAANGNIALKRASRATVHALKGEVTAGYCENCSIVAQKIRIEQAVNCELVADEIEAGHIEGCMLAGSVVRIATSADSKSRETLITMIIPDLSAQNQNIEKSKGRIVAAQAEIAGKKRDIEQLKDDPDFAKFLALYDKIKAGEIKLTADQAENWQKLVSKNARSWNQVDTLNKQILALERLCSEAGEEIDKINQQREAAGAGISCVIDSVGGLTKGQSMTSVSGLRVFDSMPVNEIKIALQSADQRKARIFSADEGTLSWSYK